MATKLSYGNMWGIYSSTGSSNDNWYGLKPVIRCSVDEVFEIYVWLTKL